MMSKYYIEVDFGDDGFSSVANIFGTIRLIMKYSRKANVTVSRRGMR